MPLTPLSADTLRDAAESLTHVPRGDARVASAVVGEVLLAQAEQRSAAVSHALIDARMGSHGASAATADTDGVRPLEVLRQGPRDERERAYVSVLMAHHIATLLERDGGQHTVAALLPGLDWLEFTGPYAPYSAARATLPTVVLDRLEPLLADTPIEASSDPAAAATRALRGVKAEASTAAVAGSRSRGVGVRDASELRSVSIAGEVEGLVRSRVARLVGVFTGWALARGGVLLAARAVFSFKRPMTLTLEGDTLRVVGHSELLGRTLRTFDIRYPLAELVEVRREVRFPALPAVLAVVALGLGVTFGARAVIEGAGVQYFPLVALGLGLILAGFAVEYLLRALFPGLRGGGRLTLRARDSRAVELTRIPLEEIDRLLDALDARFGATRHGTATGPGAPRREPGAAAPAPGSPAARPGPRRRA